MKSCNKIKIITEKNQKKMTHSDTTLEFKTPIKKMKIIKKTKNEEDELRDSIRSIGIFFTLFAFIYYINAMFPKQTTSVLKRYEAFDYINNITYIAIAIIICVLLYMIVAYFYNNNSEAPVVNT